MTATDTPRSENMVVAERIEKSFGSHTVLKDISLTVGRGEVVCVIGPSGSGKSTFLRCINHLEKIDGGRLTVDGDLIGYRQRGDKIYELKPREAAEQRKDIGMVFQRFNLFPHLTVLENLIEAPMVVQGLARDAAIARAEALLAKVGLAPKRDNYPARLSGGQKQRVAIARALCMQPDIMLFDEPTSALDPELTGEVLRTMRELAEERMTMLVVTHEMGFAREVANTVAFMDQGELIAARPAGEFFADPGHERARAFLQHML